MQKRNKKRNFVGSKQLAKGNRHYNIIDRKNRTIMKKSVLIALILIFASFATSAQVQTYPLRVCGVQVSDTNFDNIRGQYISGTVKYVDSTKTLILMGATLGNIQAHCEIINTNAPLKIMFVDTNNLSSKHCLPIFTFADTIEIISSPNAVLNITHDICNTVTTTIQSSGDIYLNASGTINMSHLTHLGYSSIPIIKNNGANTKLVIGGSPIYLNGSICPIVGFSRVDLGNYYFTKPRNTYYDTINARLTNPMCYLDSVLISGEYTPPYLRPVFPVKVAGIKVTMMNADSVGGAGISGHVSFDSLANTLILDNATINREGYNGIECDSSITIRCIGYNSVDGRNDDVISSSKTPMLLNGTNFTIQGSGSGNDTLDLNTYRYPAISTSNSLQINNLNLISYYGEGITKHDASTIGNLTITNSNAKIIGGRDCGPISGYNNLHLNQCEIARPVGHRYSTTNRRIEDSTGNLIRYMDTLVIEKTHVGLLTAGKEKTELMPNPVSTNLYVVSESVIDQLQVFDTYGRLLKTLSPTTKQAIVNVRELPNGVYTIKIKTDGGIITKRFVVRH